jgi:ACS family hexuronate transporter-like MFS transporter
MPTDQATLPLEYQSPADERMTRYRWVICALLFFGTTINYVDRQVLGFLGPHLEKDLGISNETFGNIGAAFALAYAFGQTISGRWLDLVGTRIGYAVSLALWSLASIAHAFVRTGLGFGIARAVLGVVESPCYPANNKTSAEWFPKRERSTVMGFVNAGSNLGVIVAAACTPLLYAKFGFQGVFVGTGLLGFIWLAFWLPLYRRPHEHPRVSPRELAHINSDATEPPGKIRWVQLLGYRQTWSFTASKFITDAIWYFFIMWLSKFLAARHHVDIKNLGIPFLIIYSMADVGSIVGGWLSSALIQRGMTINRARKTAMLVCIACIVPVSLATVVPSAWMAVILLGMATAGHQGFSANQYSIVGDMFPRRAVGSVSGLGGTVGYIGASIYSILCGKILTWNHGSYTPLMIIAGTGYLVAFLIIHACAPHLEPVKINEPESPTEPVMPPAPAADTLKCRAPGCGYMNREDARFCRRCGNELR